MEERILPTYSNLWVKRKEDLLQQGKTLKQFRKQAKLTQEVLAERIEISVRHLSDIENGKSDPSLTISKRWLKVTGISTLQHISYLLLS